MNTKTKVYVILLIWGAVVLQFAVNRSINREEVLVEQVFSTGVEQVQQSNVKAFGVYGNETISDKTKETIVKRVANMLGIDAGYTIVASTEENGTTTSRSTRLTKKGEQGNTDVSLITVNEKDAYNQEIITQYLLVEIELKGQAGAATTGVKSELCNIYKDLGIEPSVNMHMMSKRKGKLTEDEMNTQIDTLFDELNAKHVSYDEFQSTIMAYGYSKDIEDYVYQGKEKVNVQIAFSYDEKNDVTIMHTAVPFIDGAF